MSYWPHKSAEFITESPYKSQRHHQVTIRFRAAERQNVIEIVGVCVLGNVGNQLLRCTDGWCGRQCEQQRPGHVGGRPAGPGQPAEAAPVHPAQVAGLHADCANSAFVVERMMTSEWFFSSFEPPTFN